MTSPPQILILGAGAAGTAAARVLAPRDDVRVTLLGPSGETPYSRMLIKGIAFGPASPEAIKLPLPDVPISSDSVVAVATTAREVELASGTRLSYDALVVATGSRARALPVDVVGGLTAATTGRVSALHTLDDARRIREVLTGQGRRARVAIYGGGIIAAEAASILRDEGHSVVLISRSTIPGIGAFGVHVAERMAAEHSSRGTIHVGRTVQRVDVTDAGVVTTLDTASQVVADLLLVALGTTPAAPAPWIDGLDVDDRLRADAPDVYAAGGVATHHDALGTWRIDHWQDASAQGAHAAEVALHDLGLGDDPGPYRPRSPFMAMVYGRTIAGVGLTGDGGRLVAGDEFVVHHERQGTVVGVTGIDAVGTVYRWGQRLHTVEDATDEITRLVHRHESATTQEASCPVSPH